LGDIAYGSLEMERFYLRNCVDIASWFSAKVVDKKAQETEMHRLVAMHLRFGGGFHGGGWLGSYASALPQPLIITL